MKPPTIIAQLEKHHAVFQSLLSKLSPEEILWKKNPEKWCLLEIICHLHDEEVEDFRTRVAYCLERPGEDFPPIDPVGWVASREYIKQDFEEKLSQFLAQRTQSVDWLKNLENPNWESGTDHPKFGFRTAGFFLANWLAHDYLHLRQITRLRYDYLAANSATDIQYAGNWILD